MMGYAKFSQQTKGLHTRLYARAFVFESPSSGKRVVFVSADLAMLFSSVKQGVLQKLGQPPLALGNLYNDQNVMISATHTHSGPGGYSHHVMYNLTTYGHVAQNYAAIVDGITEAIVQAHNRLASGTVSVMSGEVPEAIVNRSMPAYIRNPDARSIATAQSAPAGPRPLVPAPPVPPVLAWPDSVNREMTVLKIESGGRPVGAISWFAVHNTSMSNENFLVSSDHKGYAAYLFEKQYGSIAPLLRYGDFVAAFPNGAQGDQSPTLDTSDGWAFKGPGRDDFESMYIIGQREFDVAHSLFTNAGQTRLPGDIDFRQKFVTMPGLLLPSTKYVNGVNGKFLCSAAYGASFPAGAEDGRPGPRDSSVPEGLALGSTMQVAALEALKRTATALITFLIPPLGVMVTPVIAGSSDPCQLPKPVLVPTGLLENFTPVILPFQLLRLGSVAIAGIPGEMTVQAGRRLQESLKAALLPLGVQRVILTGLANEYSGYITTPEEYDSQQYEGASTLYGRLTFEAYQQVFTELAVAMALGQPVVGGPPPRPLGLLPQIELQTGVVGDGALPGEPIGTVLLQPPPVVTRGPNTQVQVIYRSGHPKNDLRRNNTYFRIERSPGSEPWELVAWDAMPETKLFWGLATGNTCPACSSIGVVWSVPLDAKPGTYRIRFVGSWKNGTTGAVTRYVGATNTFVVQ